MLGQGIIPKSYDPIVSTLPQAELTESLESMRRAMLNAAGAMPSHQDFIRRYCPADL